MRMWTWSDFKEAARLHVVLVNRKVTCALHGREGMGVCDECETVMCMECQPTHPCQPTIELPERSQG
jgi:hypothetical protein